jgi:hypothetical protein
MFTSFDELIKNAKNRSQVKETSRVVAQMGRELAADIVANLKDTEHSVEYRKEMNKQRIEALGLKLIPGGKA